MDDPQVRGIVVIVVLATWAFGLSTIVRLWRETLMLGRQNEGLREENEALRMEIIADHDARSQGQKFSQKDVD
jgi:hypothetical protein